MNSNYHPKSCVYLRRLKTGDGLASACLPTPEPKTLLLSLQLAHSTQVPNMGSSSRGFVPVESWVFPRVFPPQPSALCTGLEVTNFTFQLSVMSLFNPRLRTTWGNPDFGYILLHCLLAGIASDRKSAITAIMVLPRAQLLSWGVSQIFSLYHWVLAI